MIKAIIFDFGNVISKPNPLTYCDKLEKLTGVPAAVFCGVYDGERSEFDRGILSGKDMYTSLLRKSGYAEIAENTALLEKILRTDLESWFSIRDDVTKWGLGLQKKGYKLGILSNMPEEFLALYEKKIKLFTAADYACFSCRLHIIKPEEGIYRNCLGGLQVVPKEAVFFDDMQVNIDAATAIGMHGCLWTGLEQGKKDWDRLVTTQK